MNTLIPECRYIGGGRENGSCDAVTLRRRTDCGDERESLTDGALRWLLSLTVTHSHSLTHSRLGVTVRLRKSSSSSAASAVASACEAESVIGWDWTGREVRKSKSSVCLSGWLAVTVDRPTNLVV